MVLALFINDIPHEPMRNTVKAATYMPHVVSWVVFDTIVINLLTSDGVINKLLLATGALDNPVVFMAKADYF